jgi:Tol biopolymer transport system component
MPDVREVFQMSTQKIKPDPGFVDRQHDHRKDHERRRKVGALVVVAAIGVAAAVLILTSLSAKPGPQVPALPSSSPFLPGFGPYLVDVGTGAVTPLPEELSGGSLYDAAPDGLRIAFGTCCTGQDLIRVADLDGSALRPVTPTNGLDAYGPQWSPDGTTLLYQLRDNTTSRFGSLMIQEVATGATTRLATLPGADAWWFTSPSFSPDGRTVLFQLPRPDTTIWDLWSVPVAGGKPVKVLSDAALGRYLPDGGKIAFVAGMRASDFKGRRIGIADAQGHRRTLVAGEAIWRPTISPDGATIAYADGSDIDIVDVSTGEVTRVGSGTGAEWLDDDTLLVTRG